MSDLLPVLVADLAEESARDFLEGVARENEEAWVPLVAAPVDASQHLLEVYTPSGGEPLRLLAIPTGPPSELGFPLRLSLVGAEGNASAEDSGLHVPNVEHIALGPDVQVEGASERPRPPQDAREYARYAATRTETPTLMRSAGTARRPSQVKITQGHSAELAGGAPEPEPRDALSGRQLAGGKLEIEGLVGKGMMGAVYRARHRQLLTPVAVKVLHEHFQRDVDFCKRFYAEALAASRLDHPNLVRVVDFGQEPDGLLYLAMEFVAGPTLRELNTADGPLPARRIAEIMMQVCAGLGQAHARGIVHRDVKPDNIVLVEAQDDDGRPYELVKICDFGLALLRKKDAERERFAGTPVYMSPEQCRGEELDLRTDIYACGIMLFELATGTVPFLSDKPIVVINRHLAMPPPPLAEIRPDVDPRLDRIVQKALRKTREERYASMRELRADLKELLRPVGPPAFDLEREAARASSSAPPPSLGARSPAIPEQSPPPAVGPRYVSSGSMSAVAPPRSSSNMRAAPSIPPPPRSEESPESAQMRARPSAAPEWLEDSQDRYSSFLTGMATGAARAEELCDTLAREPTKWLASLVETREPRDTMRMLDELDGAVRVLAKRADARALRAVSSTVHGIATDEKRSPQMRGRASSLLRVFADPAHLSLIAERLLARDDEHRPSARTLVLHAGVTGAYALYGARVKLAASPASRGPFVETMRSLGEAAWPVVRAALEKIPDAALTGAHPLAADLAEDLLLCVPTIRDETAGRLVAKYVRATEPALCRAATQALGRLWAERAAPLLLGLLGATDDGVRGAAIAGLREIGAVDEHVVRRLVPILAQKVAASHELRIAAVCALEYVTADARPVAVPLLVQLVRDASQDDATALAASKALLSVMGNEARGVLIERSDRAAEPLKSHMLVLLRDPKLPKPEVELDLD